MKRKLFVAIIAALSLLLSTVIFASADSAQIDGTEGKGTKSEPLIVDTFDELKAALLYDGELYIEINSFQNDSGKDYFTLDPDLGHYESYGAALTSRGNKTLTVNTELDFRARYALPLFALIYVGGGTLTLNGTGSIAASFNSITDTENAIVNVTYPGKLYVSGDITLDATPKMGLTSHGKAILNYSGYVNISGGTFIGATTGSVTGFATALKLHEDVAEAYISAGTFIATSEADEAYGVTLQSGKLQVSGGEIYGIIVPPTKTLNDVFKDAKAVCLKDDGTLHNFGTERKTSEYISVVGLENIKEAGITVAAPTVGELLSVPEALILNKIISYKWYILSDEGLVRYPLPSTYKFRQGESYRLQITISPEDGGSYAKDVKITVNKEAITNASLKDGVITLDWNFKIDGEKEGYEIDASFDSPTVGVLPPELVINSEYASLSTNTWHYIGYDGEETAENKLKDGEKINYGKYRYVFILECNFGYTFDVMPKITVGEYVATVDALERDYVRCYIDFDFVCEITVVPPKHGEAPSAPVSKDSNIVITQYDWLRKDSSPLTQNKFLGGETYRLNLILDVQNGYTFPNRAIPVTVNGVFATAIKYSINGVGEQGFCVYLDEKTELIDSVNVLIDYPIAGNEPDNAPTTDNSKVTASIRYWQNVTDDKLVGAGERFVLGKSYLVILVLNAKDGALFAPITNVNYDAFLKKFTVNGYEVSGISGYNPDVPGNEIKIRITFVAHEHKYGTVLNGGDNVNHWLECTDEACPDIVGSIKEASPHVGGAPTCSEQALCECGMRYGALFPHTPVGGWEFDTSAHWHECSECGGKEVDKKEHTDLNSDFACDICGAKVVDETHAHVSEFTHNKQAPTCTSDGYLEYYECLCGAMFEDFACTRPIDDLDAWKASGGKLSVAHTDTDSDGKCDHCGLTYDKGKTKTGVIILIVAASLVFLLCVAVAVGIGVFAIVWFLVKKKSFADLISVFKKK